jgi:hypothetical protein
LSDAAAFALDSGPRDPASGTTATFRSNVGGLLSRRSRNGDGPVSIGFGTLSRDSDC